METETSLQQPDWSVSEKVPEISTKTLTFRRAMGLPDSPQIYLESLHQERLRKVHTANQEILEEVVFPTEGLVQDRRHHQELRQQMYGYRAKDTTVAEKLQRITTIAALNLKGVKNPEELVTILEKNGSGLVFDIAHNDYIHFPPNHDFRVISRYEPDHRRVRELVDKEFVLAQLDRETLKTGLNRMQLLGFDVDFRQEGLFRRDSDFMDYFQRLAVVPEEVFNKNLDLLNYKGVYFNERSLGYSDYKKEKNRGEFEYSWGAESLLETVETGEVPEEILSRLKAVAKLNELSDGLIALPFDSLKSFKSEDLDALVTIVEHEVSFFQTTGEPGLEDYYRKINRDLTLKNLEKYSQQEALIVLSSALKSGTSIVDVLGERDKDYSPGNWLNGVFSRGLLEEAESMVDRINKMKDYLSSDDYPYIQSLRELYSKEGWERVQLVGAPLMEVIRKQANILQRVARLIDNSDTQTKINALMSLDDGYNPQLWMPRELQQEVSDNFYRFGGGEIEHFMQMSARLLCERKGKIDIDVLVGLPDKTKIPINILERYVATQPDLLTKYLVLKKESESNAWADAIPDTNLYWQENLVWLVALEAKGIDPPDLLLLRRLAGNVNVREIIQGNRFTTETINDLKIRIGLSVNNITYLETESLMFVIEEIRDNPVKEKFYRGLLNSHPREFSGVILTIKKSFGSIDLENGETQRLVLQAIEEIGAITPVVLNEYIGETDGAKRALFVEKLKIAKKKLLGNEPVRHMFEGLPNSDRLLAELITISFPGNVLSQVENDLRYLDDRVGDLARLKFSPEGYESNTNTKIKRAFLKDGEEVSRDLLKYLKQLIPKKVSTQDFNEVVVKLFRGAGLYQLNDFKNETPLLFNVLSQDTDVVGVRKVVVDQSQLSTVTQFLGRISEVVGVYFKDNFSQRLEDQISQNQELAKRLFDNTSLKRIDQIEKNLGKISDQEITTLKPALQRIREAIKSSETPKNQDFAAILSVMVGNRILGGPGGLRSQIKKEMGKFFYKDAEGESVQVENQPFKGVVSKNVASFFAKRTAGLCTAADTELFNRPDHFHINLVRGTEIIGNIQGYIIEYQGKRSFLFRGLNPSASVINHTNAEFYCEGMINIIKQFARDNGAEEVYLSEQLGGWHALTNRASEGVIDYLGPKHLKKENEVEFEFPITDSQKISKMYKLNTAK